MIRLLTIVGARPQFIKAAALSHTIAEEYPDAIAEDLLHTGQHYDDALSAALFRELCIPAPRYALSLRGSSPEEQREAMAEGILNTMRAERYDAALVYGDTTSTLAGALAAEAVGVPLMHVEAGLRSHNDAMPEEYNRVQADRRAALLFAPTPTAVANLRAEGIEAERVVRCGDVMFDSLLRHRQRAIELYGSGEPRLLLTVHRNYNADSPVRLAAILAGANEAGRALGLRVRFAVHPRTRQHLGSMVFDHIDPCPPLGYLPTLAALAEAPVVLTDSGGLQKEAFFSGRPCVVLREETEWTEIVGVGAAVLAGADSNRIAEAATTLVGKQLPSPVQFGDGHACRVIAQRILASLG